MRVERVIQGDCFDVLPTLCSESIDCVVTSPPYDEMKDYHGFPLLTHAKRIELGKELYRVLKPGSVAAVVIGDSTKNFAESLTSFRWALEWVDSCDFTLFETLIYCRDGVPGRYHNFRTEHEYILCFTKGGKPRTVNKSHLRIPTRLPGKAGGKMHRGTDGIRYDEGYFHTGSSRDAGTLWGYSASCAEQNSVKLKHTATMPDRLASDLVRCFSNEGETVLDCFAGSGTTLVAAEKCKRGYVGIELSPKYVELIHKRLENEVQGDIFDKAR